MRSPYEENSSNSFFGNHAQCMCGSNNGDSDGSGDSTGRGGYLSCVLEYTQARDAGIISATNAEISAECASESLP